jgi:formylmethanofuran dehydrogenase subunit E
MPDSVLLAVQQVTLTVSLEKLLSKPGVRVNCEICGEEIINERETVIEGTVLCRACAGHAYYREIGRTLTSDVYSGGAEYHLADH